MKPGYRTTEFWLTFLACAVGLFLSSGAVTDNTAVQVAGIIASALTALGYTVPRAGVKKIDAGMETYEIVEDDDAEDEEEGTVH